MVLMYQFFYLISKTNTGPDKEKMGGEYDVQHTGKIIGDPSAELTMKYAEAE